MPVLPAEQTPGYTRTMPASDKRPFFSVLVPTYNQAQYLGTALDSLLAQNDPDWEAVVVNDGSTDETGEVLDDYCRRHSRIRRFSKPNGGTASALNEALRHARGEWICWLSSDDLFEPTKLALHREWIRKEPGCRFFFSHFRTLDAETGQVADPPLWTDLPEPAWQIIEMLRCPYIQGNSICVHREVFARLGGFDEAYRNGQDYDMWLRILAAHPAVFVPERTCVMRVHADQGTNLFPEACFFDSARAGIAFLNEHAFEDLFPLLDLENPVQARAALSKAIDVASGAGGFVYALGAHGGLILRILEWLASGPDGPRRRELWWRFRLRARACARIHRGTTFGLLWKAAAVAASFRRKDYPYMQVRFDDVAEARYWERRAHGDKTAEAVKKYLEASGSPSLPAQAARVAESAGEAAVVCQTGARFDRPVQYGAFHATVELAKAMRRAGHRVVLFGLSKQGFGQLANLPFIGAANERELKRMMRRYRTADAVVGISRADAFRLIRSSRYAVHQHGPHRVDGSGTASLRLGHVPVICPSKCAQSRQVAYGLDRRQVYHVPNGYDSDTFQRASAQARIPHSLVFAGNVVPYKGVDIALRAFQIIRKRFPDAVFRVYGDAHSWHQADTHCLQDHWLDDRGFPLWRSIERDRPGVTYMGEVAQSTLAEAFQACALLVMPSRIDETFGIASIEAQACGCLPVLPRCGGFPETMRDGETGWLYDGNTPDRLAAKVVELWEENLPTEAQREEAARWVRQAFSWERTGAAVVRILDSTAPMPVWRQWMFRGLLHAEPLYGAARSRLSNVLSGTKRVLQPARA